MKKIISSIIFAMILLVGCGGNKPEDVAIKFTQSVYKSDIETLSSLINITKAELKKDGTKQVLDGKLSMIAGDAIQKASKKGGFAGVKVISSEKLDDNHASVQVEIKFKNGEKKTETIKTIKNEDGKWKIRL